MKHFIRLLILFIVAASTALAEDKLVSYDQATSIITVERGGQLKTFRVKPITEVTVNGTKTPIESLTPGMAVTITLSDPQTVSRIAARGVNFSQLNGRTLIIKIRVDGDDTIRVRDGKLTITHGEARKPEAININGTDWTPTWNRKETEPFTDFKSPLQPFKSQPRLKQISGRGKVEMEKMAQGNFEKILTIKIKDGESGAEDYEIQIFW